MVNRAARIRSSWMAWLAIAVIAGCEHGPQMARVNGRVLYNGKPLEFGSVTFQPPSGQPARGLIQSDGSFSLSTFEPGDGAVVGQHKVRITCYESQRDPAARGPGEQSLGRLLIPLRYTLFDQSGLTAEVRADRTEPFVFELSDP
jgi:hypothetical protein